MLISPLLYRSQTRREPNSRRRLQLLHQLENEREKRVNKVHNRRLWRTCRRHRNRKDEKVQCDLFSAGIQPALTYFAGIGSTRLSCCQDRKSTRLNSSHITISYAVFCLKK